MNEDGSGPIGLVNLFIILAIPVYFQVCFLFSGFLGEFCLPQLDPELFGYTGIPK
jgi:hypothetical protein